MHFEKYVNLRSKIFNMAVSRVRSNIHLAVRLSKPTPKHRSKILIDQNTEPLPSPVARLEETG